MLDRYAQREDDEDTRRRWPTLSQGRRPGRDPVITEFGRNQPYHCLDFRLLAS